VIEEVVFEEAPEEEETDEIFDIVEEQAAPVGGMAAFYKYFSKNLKYPIPARKAGVEGKVYVQFVVTKSGEIGPVKVLKGIGHGCDQEAIRVVKGSPKWKPAKQRGRPVNSQVTLPLVFKLT
jgi:protein TonB